MALRLLILSMLLAFCTLNGAELNHNFDHFVQKAMKTWNVPGVAIAVVKDDQIVYIKGYGVKQVGKPGRIDPYTDFAIASGTKSFTATALAMLVDEGKIKWDDPIVKYIPNIRFYNEEITEHMTFRDLLSHRTNLMRNDALWHETNLTREQIIASIKDLKPFDQFGSNWNYNNLMYAVAGEVIPAVTGKSWDEFVQERILTPLGMDHSNTSVRDFQPSSDIAMPHKTKNGKPFAIAWKNVDNIGPAISINSNAHDMAQWIRFQLADGKVGKKRLVSAQSIEDTHNVQTLIPDSDMDRINYPDAQISYYGFGWRMHNYHGNRVIEHEGMVDGMTSLVAMLPEQNMGIIILSNQDVNYLPNAVMYRAFDTLLNFPTQDWDNNIYQKHTALVD